MADGEKLQQYALVFDEKQGFQLLDRTTGLVADLAVLEGTWRKPGEELPAKPETATEEKPKLRNYGGLRIRSSGAMAYDIWQARDDE